ncbi:MAG TPA: GNAT family N-acetyltransferase [Pyrinomonadaceae bacterium]|nr:GNAT family N-acetyltransferase [Pyrinomonadaceae bacterium]
MREVENLQKEVWQSDDRDVVPLNILAATREVGAILLSAFDGPALVGFAYSFVGREKERLVHHSHMLAVTPSHRNLNLGYRLKLAQRDRALAQGIDTMTWTFDPLQSLNAHFNFTKLGVLSDTYKINFYGESTSGFLLQIGMGTDRLWVTWRLDSRRVLDRLQESGRSRILTPELRSISPLVRFGPNNAPERAASAKDSEQKFLSIEIPSEINSLQIESPQLASEWREETRRAFSEAMSAGYLVEDFHVSSRNDCSVGVYLLSRGRTIY